MKVAVIPARGGSKRIPRKNIRLFDGHPLISYSIAAAAESGCFDRVIVSTDDPEVAAVSRASGAETPFVRPPELADDHAGVDRVLRHALNWLDMHGEAPEMVCCLFATAPFVTASMLQNGLSALVSDCLHRHYAVAVASFPFPIQRAVRIANDGCMQPITPACIPVRSQDLEPAFHEAGLFYWGRADAIRHNISIYDAGASIPIVIPRHRVQDIDSMEDWVCAEYLFRAMKAMAVNAGSD